MISDTPRSRRTRESTAFLQMSTADQPDAEDVHPAKRLKSGSPGMLIPEARQPRALKSVLKGPPPPKYLQSNCVECPLSNAHMTLDVQPFLSCSVRCPRRSQLCTALADAPPAQWHGLRIHRGRPKEADHDECTRGMSTSFSKASLGKLPAERNGTARVF